MGRQLIEVSSSRGQVKADGIGDRSSAEFHFVASGCTDESDVLDLVNSLRGADVPDPYDTGTEQLSLRNIDITERINPDSWRVTVHYLGKPETTYQYDFATTTQHITQSLETVGAYSANTIGQPDFKGAIGVDGDGNVSGVDKIQPSTTWTETHYYSDDEYSDELIAVLALSAGKTNDSDFEGCSEGEVLFGGATAVQRESDLWEVTYKFLFSPSLSGLIVGDIGRNNGGISKKGWEYLWVSYAPNLSADSGSVARLVVQPAAAYVERIYESCDFSTLFAN